MPAARDLSGTVVAITGATGQLGRLAIAALKDRGAQPIALARDPAKGADLAVETRNEALNGTIVHRQT